MKQIIEYKGGAGFLHNTRKWVSNLFKRNQNKPKHKQPHVQTHAKIASESYKLPTLRKSTIDGYNYQPHVSHEKRAVYHHTDKNHSIIGHRGTNKSDSDDILDDIALATGQNLRENDRYNEESKFLKDFKRQNQGTKVSLSGHSLGSAYSSRLAYDNNLESHGFNEGSSVHPYVLLEHGVHSLNPKINKYHVKSDIISATNPFPNETIKRTGKTSHGIDNFIQGGIIEAFHRIYQILD